MALSMYWVINFFAYFTCTREHERHWIVAFSINSKFSNFVKFLVVRI